MAIYTRTGDMGMTSIRGGSRVSKGSWQMGVLGSLDEMNSQLGQSRAMIMSYERVFGRNGFDGSGELIQELREIREHLKLVQGELLEMGAAVAEVDERVESEGGKSVDVDAERLRMPTSRNKGLKIWSDRAVRMEKWIDAAEVGLPELHNFILPGGGVVGASLMVSRSVVRRVEREFVRWIGYQGRRGKGDRRDVYEQWKPVLAYLNRMSDWLFVLGRRVNWLVKEDEEVWKRDSSDGGDTVG